MKHAITVLAFTLRACNGMQLFTQRAPCNCRTSPVRMASANDELYNSLRKRVAMEERPSDPERASIRADAVNAAGVRFAEASPTSTTGPVFNADDLPAGEVLKPAQAMKGLYAAFNARDADCVASFLTDECVYEDLLLGPATVCRGKEKFMAALRFHPAFIASEVFDGLPFADRLPSLTLEVDSIAEGPDTVGVEWHVQCGDSAFPLGRGLSQAEMCATTGKIVRVVDIAEAPWRVIGLILLPFITAGTQLYSSLNSDESATDERLPGAVGPGAPGDTAAVVDVAREYELLLTAVLADEIVDPSERALLASYAAENRVSESLHVELLTKVGWTEEQYEMGSRNRTAGSPD